MSLILFISDDVAANREIRLALTKSEPDCQVEFVGTTEEIKGLRTPTLILLDLMLSRQPALDVLRWLRSDRRFKRVPVFVLGSDIIDREASEAYQLGANSCLKKAAGPAFEPIAQGIATYASLIAAV